KAGRGEGDIGGEAPEQLGSTRLAEVEALEDDLGEMAFESGADPRLIGLGPAIVALAAGDDDRVEAVVPRRRLEQRARQLPKRNQQQPRHPCSSLQPSIADRRALRGSAAGGGLKL